MELDNDHTIDDLIKDGENADLIIFDRYQILYKSTNKQYIISGEELVRAALYVYLVVHKKLSPERIGIEHKQIDLCIFGRDDDIDTIYECKATCASQDQLEKAQQQARSYANKHDTQHIFIAYGSEGHLVIDKVSADFSVPFISYTQPPKKLWSSQRLISKVALEKQVLRAHWLSS